MLFDKLNKAEQWIFDGLSLALVLFYSYSAVLAPAATQYHRGIYIIITYILVFLLYKSKNPVIRVLDYLLIVASVIHVRTRARQVDQHHLAAGRDRAARRR